MKKRKQNLKTHHVGTIVLILVLLTALIGMYYLLRNPVGRAIDLPLVDVERVGFCCCVSPATPDLFRVSTPKLASELLPSDCALACSERDASSIGTC